MVIILKELAKEKTAVGEKDTISIIPSIAGGADADIQEVESEIQLSNDEVLRYSRHLIIPEVGMDGQKKLKSGKVLMIGAGSFRMITIQPFFGCSGPVCIISASAPPAIDGIMLIVSFSPTAVFSLARYLMSSSFT